MEREMFRLFVDDFSAANNNNSGNNSRLGRV
jgi:hypothetical protein